MDQKKRHFVKFVSEIRIQWLVVTCVCVMLSAFIAYLIGREVWNQQNKLLQQQQSTMNEQIKALQHAQRQQQILQVDLNVQRKANEVMQKELTALQVNQVELEKQIGFYRKVLAPEETYSGAWVDKFAIETAAGENRYRFRMILVHGQKFKRFVRGSNRLELVGIDANGDPMRKNLLELTEEPQTALAFSFRFFQAFSMEFQLPEGMVVEHVQIKTILPSSRWQEYTENTQQFTWQLDGS